MKKPYWKRGQRIEISRKTGISIQHISDILARRRGVSKDRALILERVSAKVLKTKSGVPFRAWLFNRTTKHSAFFGNPIANK